MILSNQIRCLQCHDEPYSAHRHDMSYCKCGAVAVDGGQEYLKRVGDPAGYEDMSIVLSTYDFAKLVEALEDPSKNTLGKLCNLARYMRDEMHIDLNEAWSD